MGGNTTSKSQEQLPPEPKLTKEELEKLQIRRAQIVKEILQTEKDYVRSLSIMDIVYMNPLKEAAKAGKPIIKEEQIAAIFSIISDIFELHMNLVKELEPKIINWSEKQTIGEVFIKNGIALKMYTEYVNNFDNSLKTLARCSEKSAFEKFCQEAKTNPQSQRLDLASFLIMPVQRIPRYELLINDLLKNTRRAHKDFKPLANALEQIKSVAKHINEQKRVYENMQRILEIQECLCGKKKEKIVTEDRKLLTEGQLPNSGGKKNFYFIFNDLFLLAEKQKGLFGKDIRYKVKVLMPLSNVSVELVTEKDKPCIKILVTKKQYILIFETPEKRDAWKHDFENYKNPPQIPKSPEQNAEKKKIHIRKFDE